MSKYFWDLSATFGDNTDVAGQSTQGSANANTIDTIFQKLLAVLGVFGDQLGGIGTVAGTADAVTLTSSGTYPIQSLADGVVLAFKAGSANTGAATINVDTLGAKAIRRQGDSALSANDIVANGIYLIRYDTSYNAAAGAWVLLNPTVSSSLTNASTTEQLTGTDATKYATPDSVAALWEKGSDIASAGTISIGEGGYFHVTGTTTITDIDFATAKDGRAAILIFDGALTLTHNATTLKLPGAVNITTAANDRCLVVQDSSDNVIVAWYQKADGTSVVSSGGMTQIASGSLSGGTVDITSGITSVYNRLYLALRGVSHNSAGNSRALALNLSTNAGSAWGTLATVADSYLDTVLVSGGIWIHDIQSTIQAKNVTVSLSGNGTVSSITTAAISANSAAAVNGVRITFNPGTPDSGTYVLWGEK